MAGKETIILDPVQQADTLAEFGATPYSDFDRYGRDRSKRRTLGALLGIPQAQLTRLLGTFENTGLLHELADTSERQPTLREFVGRAFEEYGTMAGSNDFLKHPNVGKGSLSDLAQLFRAFGFEPEWDAKKEK